MDGMEVPCGIQLCKSMSLRLACMHVSYRNPKQREGMTLHNITLDGRNTFYRLALSE